MIVHYDVTVSYGVWKSIPDKPSDHRHLTLYTDAGGANGYCSRQIEARLVLRELAPSVHWPMGEMAYKLKREG